MTATTTTITTSDPITQEIADAVTASAPAPQHDASSGSPAGASPTSIAPSTPTATPVASPVAPATAAVTTAATAATASADPHTGGVALHQAIETVHMTVELAARNGYSQARIQLAPEELGEIRIHLHQTADGLVAKVTAADGAAAHTLQQGGAELRRSLESAGVTLLRLDIDSSTQNGPSAGQFGFAGGTPNGASTNRGDTNEDAAAPQPGAEAATAVALPNGTTIDVLA